MEKHLNISCNKESIKIFFRLEFFSIAFLKKQNKII
jgi:hypothetical protein